MKMKMKTPWLLGSCALATALTLSTVASAEEEPDRARFRGGVAFEGGALMIPDAVNLGVVGIRGELGAQITHLVGVYAVPAFDIVVGQTAGINLHAAVLVDFTIDDVFGIGVGPDAGVFAAFSENSAAAGAMRGGRLRLAVYPVCERGENGIRRHALAITLDNRFLSGVAGAANAAGVSVSQFVYSPMLAIGYQAF